MTAPAFVPPQSRIGYPIPKPLDRPHTTTSEVFGFHDYTQRRPWRGTISGFAGHRGNGTPNGVPVWKRQTQTVRGTSADDGLIDNSPFAQADAEKHHVKVWRDLPTGVQEPSREEMRAAALAAQRPASVEDHVARTPTPNKFGGSRIVRPQTVAAGEQRQAFGQLTQEAPQARRENKVFDWPAATYKGHMPGRSTGKGISDSRFIRETFQATVPKVEKPKSLQLFDTPQWMPRDFLNNIQLSEEAQSQKDTKLVRGETPPPPPGYKGSLRKKANKNQTLKSRSFIDGWHRKEQSNIPVDSTDKTSSPAKRNGTRAERPEVEYLRGYGGHIPAWRQASRDIAAAEQRPATTVGSTRPFRISQKPEYSQKIERDLKQHTKDLAQSYNDLQHVDKFGRQIGIYEYHISGYTGAYPYQNNHRHHASLPKSHHALRNHKPNIGSNDKSHRTTQHASSYDGHVPLGHTWEKAEV